MEKQLFTVTDLGPGDGGKGGIVQKLCLETDAHTVIKVGGAQGSHGVQTANGQSFAFSQFGCGTFGGSRTHISSQMVIEPAALIYEGNLLRYQHGIWNIFDLLTIDENALCTTPFHRIASRLRELARKDRPKGTIGVGVGEAAADAERFPELAIKARDIAKPNLRDRLEDVRKQKLVDLAEIIGQIDELWEADQSQARELVTVLQNPHIASSLANEWQRLRTLSPIVPTHYLGEKILSRDGAVVVESSHGVLTDRYYGFHPHTTRLRTLPQLTLDMLQEAGYEGRIIKVGVTRAYQIRHGAGPMVTENPDLLDKLLPGSSKDENRWQGKVRVGPLDTVALRYAINVCGGPKAFHALAVTWFDQINVFGHWPICENYAGAIDPDFFSPQGEILVSTKEGEEKQLEHQERLGNLLRQCRPVINSYELPADRHRDGLVRLCRETCERQLGIPVRMISFGPTENDKVCL